MIKEIERREDLDTICNALHKKRSSQWDNLKLSVNYDIYELGMNTMIFRAEIIANMIFVDEKVKNLPIKQICELIIAKLRCEYHEKPDPRLVTVMTNFDIGCNDGIDLAIKAIQNIA